MGGILTWENEYDSLMILISTQEKEILLDIGRPSAARARRVNVHLDQVNVSLKTPVHLLNHLTRAQIIEVNVTSLALFLTLLILKRCLEISNYSFADLNRTFIGSA